jgi:hypothetical protein
MHGANNDSKLPVLVTALGLICFNVMLFGMEAAGLPQRTTFGYSCCRPNRMGAAVATMYLLLLLHFPPIAGRRCFEGPG